MCLLALRTSPCSLTHRHLQIGIRLEDCFYIDDDGKPVYLTAGVGGQARSPWDL